MMSKMPCTDQSTMEMDDESGPLSGRLQMLRIDRNEHRSASPELRMPQPFTPRSSSPNAMLPQPSPEEDSPSSPPSVTRPMIITTPPRLHSSTSNPQLGATAMIRAHSSPAFIFSPALLPALLTPRSTSPMRSPKRVRSPFRHSSLDESYLQPNGGGGGNSSSTLSPEISSIFEDQELEITPRVPFSTGTPPPAFPGTAYASLTFPRSLRRRPASPLRGVSTTASPVLSATGGGIKFNETFPADLPYYSRSLSSSSVPSTPTSTRSRSPSISSLETIPDTPDAEMLAVEEDRRDREDRRRYWDLSSASVSPSSTSPGSGLGGQLRPGFIGGRDKRKRWSVCGAEKRGDLNLETIWED